MNHRGMSVNEADGNQFNYQIPSRNSVTSYTLPREVVSMATGALVDTHREQLSNSSLSSYVVRRASLGSAFPLIDLK
jgi:hypothetical protein